MSAEQSDDEAIAKLAYQLWESRGRPVSSAEQDWLEAEAIFAAAKMLPTAIRYGFERLNTRRAFS